MHNIQPADEYTWPRCGGCQKDLWNDEVEKFICRPCADKTAARLAELPGLFARINTTAALVRGSRRGNGTPTGSKVPPIPPNLAVLSLATVGGVATRLRDIEDAWRTALGWTVAPWRGNPGQAVPEHLRFLANNLLWATGSYESIGDDVEEIRRLHSDCTSALSPDPRPGRVKIGVCPIVLDDDSRCRTQLTASTATHKVQCGGCGSRWDDMGAWRELRLAQEAVLAADAGVVAA
jgi:hypothetical protein